MTTPRPLASIVKELGENIGDELHYAPSGKRIPCRPVLRFGLVLCLDSKSGGGILGDSNPLAERGLPELYLFR